MSDLARQVQAALKARGFNLGTTGPAGDGVDGQPGDLTWQAILAALAPAAAAQAPAAGILGMIDGQLLHVACPERAVADLDPWAPPIQKACGKFEINTVRRVASFIAQLAHEGGFIVGREENLNYRAERLCEVWPSRFPNAAAASPYAHNPEALANKTYANRLGNGDEASGDGWRFRGTGPLQITGRDNFTRFASAMGMSLDDALAYARTLEGGVMSAAWFWESNDINRLADTPGVADETRRINGGEVGLADRTARFDRTVAALLAKGA